MPYNVSSLIREGIQHFSVGDNNKLNEALALFQKAYNLDKNSIEAMYYLSATYRTLGNNEMAGKWADTILTKSPDNIPGICAKMLLLSKQTQQEECKKLISTPVSPDAGYLTLQAFGAAYQILGDQEHSIEYYSNAIKSNPLLLSSHYNLGVIYQDKGEYSKSLEAFNQVVKYWDTDFEVLSNFGYSHYMLGHYDQAIQSFFKAEKIAEMNGEEFNYYNAFGDCFSFKGNYQAAYSYYEKGMAQDQTDLQSMLNYARMAEKLGYKEEASSVADSLLIVYRASPKMFQDKYTKEVLDQIKIDAKHLIAYINGQYNISIEKHDDLIEKAQLEKQIEEANNKVKIFQNEKLKAYFEAFQIHAGNIYNGCSGALSGRLVKDNELAFTKVIGSFANKLPSFAKSILDLTCEVINGVNGIRQDNQAKNFLSSASYQKNFQESLEKAAIDITLQKEAIIMTATDERSKLAKAFGNIKKKAIVEMYDTPEKKLALIDATKLVSILILKSVTSSIEADLTEQFVDAVMNYDNIKANIQLSFAGKVLGLPGKEVLPHIDHDEISYGKKLAHGNGDDFAADNNNSAYHHCLPADVVNFSGGAHAYYDNHH